MSAALLWFLLGLTFLGVELAAPHLVLMFFGLGAWAAALADLGSLGLNVQIVVFIAVSLLSLVLLRRHMRSVFAGRFVENGGEGAENGAPHPLAGRKGRVSRATAPDRPGEVEIDGSFWRALSEAPLEPGTEIRVQGTDRGDAMLLRVASLEAEIEGRQNGR